MVLEHGGDEAQAIAAILDDSIEDCGAEQEAIIADRFGGRVAHIVRSCTDSDTTPKPPWKVRKEAYIAHIAGADEDILLVSCADKLYNARAILTDFQTHGTPVFDRFSAPRADTIWYYRSLAEVFAHCLPGALSRELDATVRQIEVQVAKADCVQAH